MARKPATKTPRTTAKAKTTKRAAAAKQTLSLKDLDHPLIRSLATLSVSNAEELKKVIAMASEFAHIFEWAKEITRRMSVLELQIKRDAQKRGAEVVNGGATHSTRFVFSGE